MFNFSKISLIFLLFVLPNHLIAETISIQSVQIDSLIKEKNTNNDMTQLELLVLYNEALKEKPKDSIDIFRQLAILNADLDQPKDAFIYTEKYISNTLDFSILDNGAYDFIKYSKEYKELKNKYLTKINILTFFYFYTALIGFFLSVILSFTKIGDRNSKIFIGSFIGANALFILDFVMYASNLQFKFPHVYRMSSSVALLFGPLLYFYFKSLKKDFRIKILDWIHFIPTAILIIFLIPLYTQSSIDKIKLMLYSSNHQKMFDYAIFIMKIASLTFYAYCIWKIQFPKETVQKPNIQAINKWSKSLFRIHLVFIVCYAFYGIAAYIIYSDISSFIYHLQIAIMCLIVIYIAYMSFVQPNIFRSEHVSLKDKLFSEKYKNSGLTEALSNELKENLIKLLIEEKIYRKSDISLELLSQKLNTTRHNTSQIINEHFHMNFFELINKFRINEAVKILEEDAHGNLNIIDIAYEVGYNNKVTFNKAFKKETNLTPSEFINTSLN